MKTRPKWNQMSKAKCFTILGMCFVLVIGFASAIYFFGYSKTVGYTISGESDQLIIIADFDNVVWKTNESLIHTQSATLSNDNGDVWMKTNFEISVVGTDPGCNESEDITYQLFHNDIEIFDDDVINMTAGNNFFQLNATAISPRACPRSDLILIEFIE
ncbi:unnamed protein product [marine sediment metagenome]|uniref:Uncharacterized protein n=1 Tax=marine sediment metagenome TaxID=412755 RepID=X1A3S8_9ZZZZ